jgi:hypothetical protein
MRSIFYGLVLAACLALALAGMAATATQQASPPHDQVVALAERAIANQHLDDAAAETFERIERDTIQRTNGAVEEDKTYRVVPTGTGTLKLLLKDGNTPVTAAAYAQELRDWIGALEDSLRTNDPAMKPLFDKAEKKRQERASFVDATRQAYLVTWQGRETIAGRPTIKLSLDPNPQFHPRNIPQEVLTHARAIIWIDERSGHLARGQAEIISDISIGAGILGKIYRGGKVTLEQEEISTRVWLPRTYRYDFSGRKFLFPFELHRIVQTSGYRKLGTASEALAIAQRELEEGKSPLSGDP